jgi:hypothetical protein
MLNDTAGSASAKHPISAWESTYRRQDRGEQSGTDKLKGEGASHERQCTKWQEYQQISWAIDPTGGTVSASAATMKRGIQVCGEPVAIENQPEIPAEKCSDNAVKDRPIASRGVQTRPMEPGCEWSILRAPSRKANPARLPPIRLAGILAPLIGFAPPSGNGR